jgi:hypothetical protein
MHGCYHPVGHLLKMEEAARPAVAAGMAGTLAGRGSATSHGLSVSTLQQPTAVN